MKGGLRDRATVEELCVPGGAPRPRACAATSGLQQPPKGGPSAASSAPSCPVPCGKAFWKRHRRWRRGPGRARGRREGARGRHAAAGPRRVRCGAGAGPARRGAAQGKVPGRWPAASERLAGFRRSWLSPRVSFGSGAAGLSAGNSRAAPAQSKQLTHLLLLPLSRETREDGNGGRPGCRLRCRPRRERAGPGRRAAPGQGAPQHPDGRARRGCPSRATSHPAARVSRAAPQPPAQLRPPRRRGASRRGAQSGSVEVWVWCRATSRPWGLAPRAGPTGVTCRTRGSPLGQHRRGRVRSSPTAAFLIKALAGPAVFRRGRLRSVGRTGRWGRGQFVRVTRRGLKSSCRSPAALHAPSPVPGRPLGRVCKEGRAEPGAGLSSRGGKTSASSLFLTRVHHGPGPAAAGGTGPEQREWQTQGSGLRRERSTQGVGEHDAGRRWGRGQSLTGRLCFPQWPRVDEVAALGLIGVAQRWFSSRALFSCLGASKLHPRAGHLWQVAPWALPSSQLHRALLSWGSAQRAQRAGSPAGGRDETRRYLHGMILVSGILEPGFTRVLGICMPRCGGTRPSGVRG